MSDESIVAIVTGLFTLLGTIFMGYISLQTAKLNRKQEAAAVEVKKVATKLDTVTNETKQQLDQISETGNKTHQLVNSGSLHALGLYVRVLRRLAESADATDEDRSLLAENEAEFKKRSAEQVKLAEATARQQQELTDAAVGRHTKGN